jgi:hypothetical protein
MSTNSYYGESPKWTLRVEMREIIYVGTEMMHFFEQRDASFAKMAALEGNGFET